MYIITGAMQVCCSGIEQMENENIVIYFFLNCYHMSGEVLNSVSCGNEQVICDSNCI